MPINIEVSNEVLYSDPTKLRKVLKQLANDIVNNARGRIAASPGGAGNAPRNRTGNLSKNMRIAIKDNTAIVTDNATAPDGSAFYALFLEMGTKASQRHGGKTRYGKNTNNGIAPHPFLSAALDDVAKTAAEKLGKAFADGITLKDIS